MRNIIKQLKPKYTVNADHELNDWFYSIITDHSSNVMETEQKLMKIREINTEKRFQKSLNKMDPKMFNDLYELMLQMV